jgi:hypothetical protein
MPVLAITDLMIKHDDLIIATQGRSFWILDDMGLVRQFDGNNNTKLYDPENSTIGNWSSELNSNNSDGTSSFTGVNPANGVVIYYNIGKEDDGKKVSIKIYDEDNKLVREITSISDSNFISYNGGPSREPVLSNKVGLNRFVWDTRHTSLIGVPYAYIEGSFRGHKAIPGKYNLILEVGNSSFNSEFEILKNPNFSVSDQDYIDLDKYATHMESSFNEMAGYINENKKSMDKLSGMIDELDDDSEVKNNGSKLLELMDNWDKKMMQRKTKAYDDVENFRNKFLADYLFILDQIKGDIPNVSEGILKSLKSHDEKWVELKKEIDEINQVNIPEYNKELWSIGIIGALN